jgi:K+-sensing histidine kinase KdpD
MFHVTPFMLSRRYPLVLAEFGPEVKTQPGQETMNPAAGAGTETLANVSLSFLPMRSQDTTIGVIGIRRNYQELLPDQRHLVGAIANLVSLAASRWVAV